MSLSRKIAAALADRAASDGPTTLAASEGPHRLSLDLEVATPVGVRGRSLEFSTADRAELSPESLRAWGDRLSAKLSYLMEPIRVLESDPSSGEVLLRSQAPTRRDETHGFYEVRLGRSGTLRLVRIAFEDSDRRRQSASFQLSGEVLERLADDLVASVA